MKLFCWLASATIVGVWAMARTLHPGKADFPHEFFLYRYAVDVFFLNGVMVMFAWPLLVDRGILGANYHEEDERGKAKLVFVLNGLLLPGVILLLLASLATREAYVPAGMISAFYLFVVLKNGYVYLSKNGSSA